MERSRKSSGAVRLINGIAYQYWVIRTDNIDITAHKILYRVVEIDRPAEYLLALLVKMAYEFRRDIRLFNSDIVRVFDILRVAESKEYTVSLR